jgi:hypothetical protein
MWRASGKRDEVPVTLMDLNSINVTGIRNGVSGSPNGDPRDIRSECGSFVVLEFSLMSLQHKVTQTRYSAIVPCTPVLIGLCPEES